MIVYRRMGLAFGELDHEPLPDPMPRVDILRITTSKRLPGLTAPAREAHTLIVDLRRAEAELFSELEKNTRYEINRASARDGLEYAMDADGSEQGIAEFCEYYDRFAASKGLRPIFRERLHLLAQAGNLFLSRAGSGDGEILVRHAYVRCPDRVVLTYSASHFRDEEGTERRRLAGRANRLTHWKDIVTFKQMGIDLYDMGGIDITGRSPETTNIAAFKRAFGGSVTPVYSYTVPRSLPGRVACRVAALVGREL